MNPIISVIIPSYNHAAYILDAMQSVLTQSLSNIELIVVDDGSTDESLALIQSIGDQRLLVIAQENQGAHVAINRGLHIARGDYLTILNSDDFYMPKRLEAIVETFEQKPSLGLVGSYINVVDSKDLLLAVKEGYYNLDPWTVPDSSITLRDDDNPRTAILMQNYWSTTSNFAFSRETYRKHGPFLPLKFVHDWDFALRVLRKHESVLIKEPLLNYRVHESNTIKSNKAAMVYEICWVLAQHVPLYFGESWFLSINSQQKIQQISNSVHVFGCESVLWQMMMIIHFGTSDEASKLLDVDSPVRQLLLGKIMQILKREETSQIAPTPTLDSLKLKSSKPWWKTLLWRREL